MESDAVDIGVVIGMRASVLDRDEISACRARYRSDRTGGRDNDPRFGARMRGMGEFSTLIERRFALAVKRLGLNRDRVPMDTARFRAPRADARQAELFD